MGQGKKESSPRLDHYQQAIFPEYACSFSKCLIEIIRKHRQVMQAALDNKNIFTGILKWEPPAIPDHDLARPGVLGSKGRRQVDPFDIGEAEPM